METYETLAGDVEADLPPPPRSGRGATRLASAGWADRFRGPTRRTAEARSAKAGRVREASLKGSPRI